MKRLGNLIYAVGIMSIFVFGVETFAKANGSKTNMEITTEQRQKMADVHDKMAVCMRTERPMSDCQQEMMNSCQSTMGKDGCGMMGDKMAHGGHHNMMGNKKSSGMNGHAMDEGSEKK